MARMGKFSSILGGWRKRRPPKAGSQLLLKDPLHHVSQRGGFGSSTKSDISIAEQIGKPASRTDQDFPICRSITKNVLHERFDLPQSQFPHGCNRAFYTTRGIEKKAGLFPLMKGSKVAALHMSSSRVRFSEPEAEGALFNVSSKAYCEKKLHLIIQRSFSTRAAAHDGKLPYEEETVKKVGWVIKLLAAVTLTYVGFNIFPIMGDSLIWQSVALVRYDDPFMKRSGASRISLIATNDRRRKSIVEAGGVKELVKMLETAADDNTRREAAKALVSLCHCDMAVEAFHETGAEGFVRSLATAASDSDVQNHSLVLLQKLDKWKQEIQ